jgi:hypothetical protein
VRTTLIVSIAVVALAGCGGGSSASPEGLVTATDPLGRGEYDILCSTSPDGSFSLCQDERGVTKMMSGCQAIGGDGGDIVQFECLYEGGPLRVVMKCDMSGGNPDKFYCQRLS